MEFRKILGYESLIPHAARRSGESFGSKLRSLDERESSINGCLTWWLTHSCQSRFARQMQCCHRPE
jgi:hypothetical protein